MTRVDRVRRFLLAGARLADSHDSLGRQARARLPHSTGLSSASVDYGGTAGLGADEVRERESFDTLEGCEVEQACAAAEVHVDECEYVDREATLCILIALRDSAPGLYASKSVSCSASGNLDTERFYRVHADGAVSTAQHQNFDGDESYGDAGLCSLQDTSFFETCIELLESEALDYDSEVGVARQGTTGSRTASPNPSAATRDASPALRPRAEGKAQSTEARLTHSSPSQPRCTMMETGLPGTRSLWRRSVAGNSIVELGSCHERTTSWSAPFARSSKRT